MHHANTSTTTLAERVCYQVMPCTVLRGVWWCMVVCGGDRTYFLLWVVDHPVRGSFGRRAMQHAASLPLFGQPLSE